MCVYIRYEVHSFNPAARVLFEPRARREARGARREGEARASRMALRVVRCRWGGLALSLSLALSLPLPLALSLSLALPLPLALSLSRSLAVALSLSLALSLSCGWRVEGSGGPVLVVVVVWWRRGSGGGGGGTSVPGRRAGRRRERASAMACGWRGERQLAAARYVATRAASELTNTLSHPVVDWKPASNEWPPLLRRAARFRYFLCASQNRGVTS